MTNIDYKLIAYNLDLVDGIWVSTTSSDISYPNGGNELCFHLEEDSFWFHHRNNCIIETIKQFPPSGPLFDVGGGNGFVVKALEENNIEAVLVEPGKKGVANARKRGLGNIICSTLEDAGFKRHTLPAVGLFDVLEHIQDQRVFLKNVFHLLEHGGKLYITVPAFRFLWSAEDQFAGHFTRYTAKTTYKLLTELGFHVDYATYIFSLLPLPIFLFRSLPHKLGFKNKTNRAGRYKRQHFQKKGITGKLLEKIWNTELERIKSKKTIPFGSSYLVAASHPAVTPADEVGIPPAEPGEKERGESK